MTLVKETRAVANFEEVVMEGDGELIVTQGEPEALAIEADAALLPNIRSDVRDGRLTLGPQHSRDYSHWGPVTYRLTMKTIRGISIPGSGSVATGEVRTDRCRLRLSGSGRASLARLTAASAEFQISGSGRIDIDDGEVGRQVISITGSGHLDAGHVACEEAEVQISGSGNVRLQASRKLDVDISGSGEVSYRGQAVLSQHVSGSGHVRQSRG